MTDRYNSLTVALDRDTRDDDAKQLIDLIRSIRGVTDVTGNVVDVSDYVAHARADQKWKKKLLDLLNENL